MRSKTPVLLLLLMLFGSAAVPVYSQDFSRWALGRPSLLVDMPGQPSGGIVPWMESSPYAFVRNSWSGESEGIRVEVARVYAGANAEAVFSSIASKLGVNAPAKELVRISGRRTLGFDDGKRFVRVIDRDPETGRGSFWAMVVTIADGKLMPAAQRVITSIDVEREGSKYWALRGLGGAFVAAKMPYELLGARRSEDSNKVSRYESHFEGMSIAAVIETVNEGFVFRPDESIKGILEQYSGKPNTKNFRHTRKEVKIGNEKAVQLVLDFEENGKPYKIYKVVSIQKQRALTLTITTDPRKPEHQVNADRVLSSLKATNVTMTGWKISPVGTKGLYIDAPGTPKGPKQVNAVTIYEIPGGLSSIEIRELETSFPANHDPDFAAKNYFDLQNAISNTKFTLLGIDNMIVDGLQARLVKATWKNGENTNYRQILLIYGYETQWIIDVLAAIETVDVMERVMGGIQVRIPSAPGTVRQRVGEMGLSIAAFPKIVPTEKKTYSTDPTTDLERDEMMANQFPGGVAVVYGSVFKKPSPVPESKNAMFLLDSFLRGVSEGNGPKLSGKETEKHNITIDGIDGLHIIARITPDAAPDKLAAQADILLFGEGRNMAVVMVITNYQDGMEARINRARVLSSVRIGL